MSETTVGQLGRTLGGRYELVAVIGSGASARVYHAKDLRLGRSVAIKQLRPGYAEDPRFLKLFRSEATLAARLTHPNIMTVYDWSDDADGADGGPYLVTQLLSGGTLRGVLNEAGTYDENGELLKPGTLSVPQVAFTGLQAAQGLAFAHEQGLVHRDIKPANLLFGQDGRIHIGDFGIARAVAEAAWTEPEGVLIGTARYAAPEQATDALIQGPADVYSLTVCLVEALTGTIPLVRENALGTMVQRQKTDIPVRAEWGLLAEALANGGRADPEQRSTSAELLDDLLEACRALPDPEPLELLDLTFIPDRPVGSAAAVIAADGLEIVNSVSESDSVGEGKTSQVGSSGTPVGPSADESAAVEPAAVEPAAVESAAESGEPDESVEPVGVVEAAEESDSDSAVDDDGHEDGYEPVAGLGVDKSSSRSSRSSRVRRLALVLLVLAAAGGAVYGGTLLARSREKTTTIEVAFPIFEVTDYSSMTPEEVKEVVEPWGWAVESTEVRRDGTTAGELLEQSPEPGAEFAPGSGPVIELIYSAGPELRAVPTLVGERRDDAEAALEKAKLTLGDETTLYDEQVLAGEVMAASIDGKAAEPGSEWETGTVVDLTVSAGPEPRVVPDISTMSVEAAKKAIDDIGLTFAISEKSSYDVDEGDIISQSPGAGTKLDRGKAVTITVSTGLPYITIPPVTGLSVGAASTKLEDLGFRITGVDGSPTRTVTGTTPAEGLAIRYGGGIKLSTQ